MHPLIAKEQINTMHGSTKSCAEMILAALLICASVVLTECYPFPETHMSVANVIVGKPVRVHCFSGDDDLGYHQLAYLEALSWSFHFNPLKDTKFYCTITTDLGSGSYLVYEYDDISVDRCGTLCVWKVEYNGPCLQQTDGNFYCLPWTNHA